MMNSVNISKEHRISVLSPVHIGSGNKYLKGIDFIDDRQKRRTGIVDLNEISSLISNNRKAINSLSEIGGRDYKIDDFIREYRLEPKLHNIRYFPFTCYTRDILEFQRNGMGVPQIPGSSIKGSIRSAILHHLFTGLDKMQQERLLRNINPRTRDKFAGQEIEKVIFGREPNTDFMKAVIITDADFITSDIELSVCQVLLATRDSNWDWKKNRYNDFPMASVLENLKTGSESDSKIRFNDFFINDPKVKDVLRFGEKCPSDFKTLNNIINNFSRELVQKELDFLYKYDQKDDLKEVTSFYENLTKRFPDDNQGCILRLGWGSGWTSMTGNILDNHDEYLNNFRQWFRMGSAGFEYPKSRKIIMRGRNPVSVPGWIKMEMT